MSKGYEDELVDAGLRPCGEINKANLRTKENGASEDSADSRSLNESERANAPNGKAGVVTPGQTKYLPRDIPAYSGREQRQTQCRNGNGRKAWDEPVTGSIIGTVRKPYGRIPRPILDDERLGVVALGVLCYLFSRPPTWEISIQQLRERFGGHGQLIRQAFKQMQQAGYAARAMLLCDKRGKHGRGQMWFVRRSLDVPWPNRFLARDFTSLTLRFCDVRKVQRTIIIDYAVKKISNDHGSRRKHLTRKAAKNVSVRSSSLFTGSTDQYQNPSSLPEAHIKWPEFVCYCRSRGGRPTTKGFRTWLDKQKPYWRDRVKEPDEQNGYMLDAKFLTVEQATQRGIADPDLMTKFRPAVRRRGGKIDLKGDRSL